MNRNEIFKKIVLIFTDELELEMPEKLDESINLSDDLGLNSILLVQLVVHLENEFNIAIPEEIITKDNFVTIKNLIDLIIKMQK